MLRFWTPKETSEKKNEVKVWRKLYGNYAAQSRMTPKFKVGDFCYSDFSQNNQKERNP